jgi:hypothetical protein
VAQRRPDQQQGIIPTPKTPKKLSSLSVAVANDPATQADAQLLDNQKQAANPLVLDNPPGQLQVGKLKRGRFPIAKVPRSLVLPSHPITSSAPSFVRILSEILHVFEERRGLANEESHVRQELEHPHGYAFRFRRSNH